MPLVFNPRLARHNITRLFQLHEDVDQQDKLTTWMEFLDYEYKIYDACIRSKKKEQREYEYAWDRLVDVKETDLDENGKSMFSQSEIERVQEEDSRIAAVGELQPSKQFHPAERAILAWRARNV